MNANQIHGHGHRVQRRPFRLFRWEFLWVSIVAALILVPALKPRRTPVHARTAPGESASASVAARNSSLSTANPFREPSSTVSLANVEDLEPSANPATDETDGPLIKLAGWQNDEDELELQLPSSSDMSEDSRFDVRSYRRADPMSVYGNISSESTFEDVPFQNF